MSRDRRDFFSAWSTRSVGRSRPPLPCVCHSIERMLRVVWHCPKRLCYRLSIRRNPLCRLLWSSLHCDVGMEMDFFFPAMQIQSGRFDRLFLGSAQVWFIAGSPTNLCARSSFRRRPFPYFYICHPEKRKGENEFFLAHFSPALSKKKWPFMHFFRYIVINF